MVCLEHSSSIIGVQYCTLPAPATSARTGIVAVRRPGGLERPGAEHPDRPGRGQLVLLMESGFAAKIKDESWQSYQHEYGSAGGTETAIDLDTDMMRLATGGSAS